jgi:dUTP pyrophosphatase
MSSTMYSVSIGKEILLHLVIVNNVSWLLSRWRGEDSQEFERNLNESPSVFASMFHMRKALKFCYKFPSSNILGTPLEKRFWRQVRFRFVAHHPNTEMTDATTLLKVKKLSSNAQIPVRASEKAAGYDLFAAYQVEIPKRGKALVGTDIAIAIPPGHYGRIAPRSSLASKFGLDVGAGVIDEDYRGHVMVLLFNHSDKDYTVQKGERIAQLLLERISTPPIVEVEELDTTQRGSGGFGSTGTNSVLSNAHPQHK